MIVKYKSLTLEATTLVLIHTRLLLGTEWYVTSSFISSSYEYCPHIMGDKKHTEQENEVTFKFEVLSF